MEAAHSLTEAVRRAYSAAARRPTDEHAFPVGRGFAESIGYPHDLLDAIPCVAYEAFTGVSCVSILADIRPGSRLLDLGCGAGLDSLIAAERVGPDGYVTGIDFSDDMLARARQAADQRGCTNVDFRQASAASLPFDDASFDIAIVNGIFNLNPARTSIFQELARVIRPGGDVWVAELILKEPLASKPPADESNWFA